MLELAHGRHEALGSLYSRHSRLVFYLALQSLERRAAEELVQEVFLTIWRGASAFDPEQGSFLPWLMRLAHWRILNELRPRHRRPEEREGLDDEDDLFQQVLDQEPGPEERVCQAEHRRIRASVALGADHDVPICGGESRLARGSGSASSTSARRMGPTWQPCRLADGAVFPMTDYHPLRKSSVMFFCDGGSWSGPLPGSARTGVLVETMSAYATSKALIYAAMGRLMLRRLARQ